jgi:hypothetical protein
MKGISQLILVLWAIVTLAVFFLGVVCKLMVDWNVVAFYSAIITMIVGLVMFCVFAFWGFYCIVFGELFK